MMRQRPGCHRGLRFGLVLPLLTVIAFVSAPSRVSAQASRPILAFESHVGSRAKADVRLFEQLAAALELHGFAAQPASILKLLGGRAPRPGIADRGLTLADLAERINLGFNAYISSRFEEASQELSKAIGLIQTNPALVVMDAKNESMMLKAFMGLALSQGRLKETAASEATMAEVIRTFAGQPISRAEYGQEAADFYRLVLKRLQGAGRGSLTVKTGNERALIFVDEHLRGVGSIAIGDLLPGAYRLLVQLPGTVGRRYEIEVKPNEDTFVDIVVEIEDRLTVDETWIGFVFGNESERANEARYAVELTRRWTEQSSVAVVGTTSLQGKRVVVATLYRSTGEVLRAAVVNVDEASDDRLRSLARFIADGTPDQGLNILHGEHAKEPQAVPTQSRSVLGPVLTISGVVGLAGSVVLYAFDEDPSPDGDAKYQDTAPAAVAIGAVSAIVVGIGIWQWLRRPASVRPKVSPRPDGATFGFELAF